MAAGKAMTPTKRVLNALEHIEESRRKLEAFQEKMQTTDPRLLVRELDAVSSTIFLATRELEHAAGYVRISNAA